MVGVEPRQTIEVRVGGGFVVNEAQLVGGIDASVAIAVEHQQAVVVTTPPALPRSPSPSPNHGRQQCSALTPGVGGSVNAVISNRGAKNV